VWFGGDGEAFGLFVSIYAYLIGGLERVTSEWWEW
jgi:hypothetical protein